MTTTDPLATIADGLGGQHGARLEAVVAVEQARVVAQVAAQVQVAQRFPRDMARVLAELDEACSHLELARVSFWALPNRGQGLSVHLARELAVIMGNVDYGVHELRRDDERGVSEVQAFCWDVQRNSRATRTFQVPHQTMKKINGRQVRVPIDDLQDVYRNNQNVGARAVRECVFATLPRWLVDRAERLCRETLHRGDGKPLDVRRSDALAWFAREQRVTREQLEHRVGRPVEQWTPEDVAQLLVVADSIRRGETTAAEQFDPVERRVSIDELEGPAGDPSDPRDDAPPAGGQVQTEPPNDDTPPEPAEPSHPVHDVNDDPRPITQAQVTRLILRLRDHDVETDEDQREWLTAELGRPIESRKDVTRGELAQVDRVLDVLDEARGEQS
jgi:hypothetical protein